MSALERRCRVLLLAYPAAYRRERGDEIIGTLLMATPPGRQWPLLRDGLALPSPADRGGQCARCRIGSDRGRAMAQL
jgi:hypothetical protein